MDINNKIHQLDSVQINLNRLVFTSSDYKLGVSFGLVTLPVLTLEEVTYSAKKEADYTYVIGSEEPVDIKTQNAVYEGTIVMQVGELETVLAANGFTFATQVLNGTISIIAFNGLMMTKIFKRVAFLSHDSGTKAKNKDSKVTLNWKAVSAQGL
jgi:hypothetical protein